MPNKKPNPAEHFGNIAEAEKDDSNPQNPKAIIANADKTTPNTEGDCDNTSSKDRHWLDYITAIFAFLAVIASGIAAIFSGVQANRAGEANQISSKALTAVQRAFITVSELKQELAPDIDGVWRFTPVIKNTGTTPAENVTLVAVNPRNDLFAPRFNRQEFAFFSWKIGAPRDPDEFLIDNISSALRLSDFTIGPQGGGVTASELSVDLTTKDIEASFSNSIGRFIYGSIHYDDVFSSQHVSKFCFRIDGISIRNGKVSPLQSICRHWNCTDQYCQKDKAAYETELKTIVASGMPRHPGPSPMQAIPALPWPVPPTQPQVPSIQPNP